MKHQKQNITAPAQTHDPASYPVAASTVPPCVRGVLLGELQMITKAINYEHPIGGQPAYTVAILPDGRRVMVDGQYGVVLPLAHLGQCEMMDRVGGECTCGALVGIDVDALITDARISGKFGTPPSPGRDRRAPVGASCRPCHVG